MSGQWRSSRKLGRGGHLGIGIATRTAQSHAMIRVVALASLPLRKRSAMVSKAGNFLAATSEFWRTQLARLTHRYHPELHYMRGPGPKWREKHPEANIDPPH
jgi:hypothetical protein